MEVSTDSTVQTTNMYNYLDPTTYNSVNNTFVSTLVLIGGVIIIFVFIFLSLGNKGNQQTQQTQYSGDYNKGINIITILLIILFITIVFLSGMSYFYSYDMTASLKNFLSGTPTIDIKANNVNSTKPPYVDNEYPDYNVKQPKEQVYHIPGNYFGYEDAKSICKAYGSRLATYNELENAYNDGAEWCSYGWSKDQMALFPTQESTYNQLKKVKGHEHDCGRPGINGGHMANPELKFGVNCYGVKPEMTPEEEDLMLVDSPYPKNSKDIKLDERVDFWKKNIKNLLVAPFNKESWNKY
jgi:hypothetical protein